MADKKSEKIKSDKDPTVQRVDISQAVNRTITLPSALKPAKPPKGSKWDKKQNPSTEGLEKH